MKKSRPGRLAVTTLSLATLSVSPVFSQDQTGIRATLSFDQSLEISDNPGLTSPASDTEYTSRTSLGFGLSSETRSEQFRFNVGADLRGAFGSSTTSDDDFDIRNHDIGVNYARQGANSELTLSGRYRNFDFDDEVFGFFIDGQFDPDALVIDGGRRKITNYSFGYEFGMEGPFGAEFTARSTKDEFENTTDPDLVSSDRTSFDAAANFRIDPAMTVRATAGTNRRDEEDATETSRRNQYFGLGVRGEMANGLAYSGQITIDDSETYELGALTTSEDGVGVELDVTQGRPDGSIGVGMSSRVDESGRRTTADVTRKYDLTDGQLSLSLGVVEQESEDLDFTAEIGYVRQLSDSRLSANFTQKASTRDGAGLLNTSLQLNYRKEINAISSWDAGLSYGSSAVFGDSSGDALTSASLGYTRQLNDDWDFRTGLETIRVDQSGSPDRSENSVFFSVGRDFSFGF